MEVQSPPQASFVDLAARLARGVDPQLHVDDAALRLAAEFQPGLDVGAALARLDELAERAAPALQAAPPGLARISALVDHLRRVEGFRGEEEHYEHPRNSFLDQVLIRRRGIPITLAIVTMEVGRRLGIGIEGVNFPQHFLARSVEPPRVMIDAFFGRVLSDDECALRWKRAMGDGPSPDHRTLPAATLADILKRMLSNLERSFVSAREFVLAASCCDRILLLAPDDPGARRDRGLLYEHLECFDAAAADLERFLALAPDDPSADTVRRRLDRLRRQAAPLH